MTDIIKKTKPTSKKIHAMHEEDDMLAKCLNCNAMILLSLTDSHSKVCMLRNKKANDIEKLPLIDQYKIKLIALKEAVISLQKTHPSIALVYINNVLHEGILQINGFKAKYTVMRTISKLHVFSSKGKSRKTLNYQILKSSLSFRSILF